MQFWLPNSFLTKWWAASGTLMFTWDVRDDILQGLEWIIKAFLCACVHMYVCNMYVCIHVCMGVHTYICKEAWGLGVSSSIILHLFLRLYLELSNFASPQDPPVPTSPVLERSFKWVLGIKPMPSCSRGKHFLTKPYLSVFLICFYA